MNGATALIETLAECGVDFCFANPGTSEMHLVQALDAVPRMKSVLALFEGVCTRRRRWCCPHDRKTCRDAAPPWSWHGQWYRQPAQCPPC